MLGQMIAKVVLSIVLVPLLIMLLVGIGRRLDRAGAATPLEIAARRCLRPARVAGVATAACAFLQRSER